MALDRLTPADAGAAARDKINAAIVKAGKVDSKADQRAVDELSALAAKLASQSSVNAVNRRVDFKAEQAELDLISSQMVSKADVADLAPIEDTSTAALAAALAAQAAAPPSPVRPGDGTHAFTFATSLAALGGEADALPPLGRDLIAFAAAGGVVRIKGLGIVAAREANPIEPGRITEVRAAFRRRANPSDPRNDTVRTGLLWLDQVKTPLAGPAFSVVSDLDTLLISSGRQEVRAYVAASAGDGVTIIAPPGAAYFRRFVYNYGLDGTTDIEALASTDVTGLIIPPAVTTDFQNRLAAQESHNAGPRLDALEAVALAPNSLAFATRSDAQAAIIPASVTTLLLRGEVDAGDGGGGLYGRAAGPAEPGDFASADGARWRHSEDAGAVAYRVDPADPTAVQRRVSEDLRDRPTHINLFTPIIRTSDDDTPYFLAQADHKRRMGGGIIDLPRKVVLRQPGSIAIPANVSIRSGIGSPGMTGNNYSLGGYGRLNGIALDAASKLVPFAGSSVERALIYRRGMAFPEKDESAFAGVAIEVPARGLTEHQDDVTLDRVMILGFAKCVYSDGNARLTMNRVLMDGKSGLDLRNSFDIARIMGCHAFPFVSLPAAANGYPGARLTRSGIGFNFQATNDGTMSAFNLALGYQKNFRTANLNSMTHTNCWSDGTREYPGSYGFSTEGTCTDVHYVGCQSAGQQIGFYQDTLGGVITHYDGCQAWLNSGSHDPYNPVSAFDGHNWLIDSGDFNIQGGVSRDAGFGITIVSPAATGTIEMAFRNILNNPINNFGQSPFVVIGNCDYGNFGYDYSSGQALVLGSRPVLGAAVAAIPSASVLKLPATGSTFLVFGDTTINLVAGMYPGRVVTLVFSGGASVAMQKTTDGVWVDGAYLPELPLRRMGQGSVLHLIGGTSFHYGTTNAPVATS